MGYWTDAATVDPLNSLVYLDLSALEGLLGNDARRDQWRRQARRVSPEGDYVRYGYVGSLVEEGRPAARAAVP